MIDGLLLINQFVSEVEANLLVAEIDRQNWRAEVGRHHTQHYGARYDYDRRVLSSAAAIPSFLSTLCDKVGCVGNFSRSPDQVIVNNYLATEGIPPHIDNMPTFGPVVASLSLLSSCVMNFRFGTKSATPFPILLAPCSLLLLSGPARTQWYHEIESTPHHMIQGRTISRSRRISVTFRTIETQLEILQ